MYIEEIGAILAEIATIVGEIVVILLIVGLCIAGILGLIRLFEKW